MIEETQTTAQPETASPATKTVKSKKKKGPNAGAAKTATTTAIVKAPDKKALLAAKVEKLESLAAEIRQSQESIGLLSKSAKEKMAETSAEVVRCGALLSECKKLVGHGGWLKWLKANCKISAHTAQVYMRVSRSKELSNTERARYLEEPKSIRQAIALLSDGKKKAAPKKEKESAGQENGEDAVQKIAALAKKLFAALQALPPGKRNDACEALGEVNKWLKDSAIDV
jgi:hypothetical protein